MHCLAVALHAGHADTRQADDLCDRQALLYGFPDLGVVVPVHAGWPADMLPPGFARDRWVQLTMTYDGSGKAAGLILYLDGALMPMEVTKDHLTKDILFDTTFVKKQPGPHSSVKVDIVQEFVTQCRKYGLMPGLYYCSWDNKHLFGSITPPAHTGFGTAYTTEKYREFQWNQLEELCTQYGEIGKVWIDIPTFLPRDYREDLYRQIVKWQPKAVVTFNNGHGDGTSLKIASTWPTDLLEMERQLPDGNFMSKKTKYEAWKKVDGKGYYLPGEMNLPIGNEWFFGRRRTQVRRGTARYVPH